MATWADYLRDCPRCGEPRPDHSFYALADGELVRVEVCRVCRQQPKEPKTEPRIRERE
jgi:hypothetical protein